MEKLIPIDILSNILVRLPAKQLAQTRCVSKTLCALLSQPEFIKSHRDHHSLHNKDDDDLLLVFNLGLSLNNDKLCMVHHSKSPNVKINDLIKLPVNFPSVNNLSMSVIGSVNGLICFHSCDSSISDPSIHIWNPSLSALITLPPYDTSYNVFGEFEFFFRFGYDPKTDDYKVVKLMSDTYFEGDTDYYYSPGWTQVVEVYSMRKHSWKSITERFPDDVKGIFDGNEVCIDGHDGHIHWLCSYVVEGVELLKIVAYDLFAETFSVIHLPNSIRENKAGRLDNFGFLAGKLCFMSHIRHNGEFEVWVMQEYGVAESWVKHFLSRQLSGTNMIPIGFKLNNKFVYYIYGTKEDYKTIALYDLDTTIVKYFNSRLDLYGNTKVVQFVDSLVWVAH